MRNRRRGLRRYDLLIEGKVYGTYSTIDDALAAGHQKTNKAGDPLENLTFQVIEVFV